MTNARPDSRLGTDLGPYRIESVIGRVGMSVVYLAEQPSLGRKVALKVIAPEFSEEPRAKARFLRESQMAAAIDHPNILPIHEAGEIDGVLFIAMRYVEGEDLARRLAREPLSPRAAVAILAQVAAALDAAHARGLIHRDVKPANILLDAHAGPDGQDHAYLTDFGLTKRGGSEGSLTAVGGLAGILAYIAPEQVEGGAVDGRTDEYALACVAYECLLGRPPFARETDIALAMAHLRDPVPSAVALNPKLPAAVDTVVARGLAKDPAERFESCSVLVAELRAALSVSSSPDGAALARERDRRPWLAAAGVLAGAGVLAAVAVGFSVAGRAPATSPGVSLGVASLSPRASPELSTPPTVDISAFPNADERMVIAMLPAALQRTCARGAEMSDASNAGFVGSVDILSGSQGSSNTSRVAPPTPSVNLTCSPNEGAARVHFLWYKLLSEDNATDFLSIFAVRWKIPDGDCATDSYARQAWSNERLGSGLVVCLRTAPFDGSPWVDWSFADGRMLALATRDDRDFNALYEWFQSLRTFLA